VQSLDDGRVALDLAGSRSVFREVKPWLWEEEHGRRRLQAVAENGRVLRWGLEPYVFAFVFEPVPALSGRMALALFLAAVGMVLLTALLWPVAAVLRRRHGVAAPGRPVLALRLASVGVLVALGLWATVIARLDGDLALGALLPTTQAVTIVSFLGGLGAALWWTRSAWRRGTASRVLSLAWLLSFAVLVLIGASHHLMSFNQNF